MAAHVSAFILSIYKPEPKIIINVWHEKEWIFLYPIEYL
jgi:hypothetical protein